MDLDQADNLRLLVKQQKEKKVAEIRLQGDRFLSASSPSQPFHPARIIAVTSGKGGVGKTNLTLNLALSLSKEANKKVLVLDADFGTANVDIVMGIFPKYNISHLFYDNKSLEDVVIDAPYQVKILPGVSGMANLTTLTEAQKERFFDELDAYQSKHKLDYILIDTGAGLGANVINFLLASDEVIVVVTPEPTSMSDAYAIIKVLNQYNSELKVNIVANMVVSEEGAKKVFQTLQSVTEKFLNKNLEYLGFVRFDKHLSSAVRQQKPLVLSYPNSEVSLEIFRLANSLDSGSHLSKRSIKSFFELAGRYFGWNND